MRKAWLLIIFYSKCLVRVGIVKLATISREQSFLFICFWASRHFCFENGPYYFSCTDIYGYPAFAVFVIVFFHLKIFIFILYVWLFCLIICGYTSCMPGALGSQKRVSDPLELELQMVVGIESGSSGRAVIAFKC